MGVAFFTLLLFTVAITQGQEQQIASDGNSFSPHIIDDPQNVHKVKERIISATSTLLAKYLQSDCFQKDKKFLQLSTYINSIYHDDTFNAIYFDAADILSTEESPVVLADSIWSLYRKGNLVTFKLMLEVQLHLFALYEQRARLNDAYLLHLGYYFYRTKKDPLYNQLNNFTRSELDMAIQHLPKTLQYFYFAPQFCLYNKGYDELLRMSNELNVDANFRFMYSVMFPSLESKFYGALENDFTLPANGTQIGTLPFEVSLKLRNFDKFLFMDERNDKVLLAWERDYQSEGSLWTMKYRNGTVVFEQHGYLMCDLVKLEGEGHRRLIYGFENKGHTETNKFCQWKVMSCA